MRVVALTLVVIMAIGLFARPLHACHLSDLRLDSVVDQGGSFDVAVTLCIGAGITGSTRGGDQSTHAIGFEFFGGGLTVNTFAPASITSEVTALTMSGFAAPGPVGQADALVVYANEIVPNPFTCITSTATCGPVHSECKTYQFNVSQLPTQIQARGVEGAGNPVGGCYPNFDMGVYPASKHVRLARIDADSDQVTVRNFGPGIADARYMRFRTQPSLYLSDLPIVGGGDLTLSPGEEVTVMFAGLPAAGAIGLYFPPGKTGPTSGMQDFAQWNGSLGNESTAVELGIWSAGTSIAGPGPSYVYTGDGSQNGAGFWASLSPAAVVPALSPFGMAVLACMLAALGCVRFTRSGRRR